MIEREIGKKDSKGPTVWFGVLHEMFWRRGHLGRSVREQSTNISVDLSTLPLAELVLWEQGSGAVKVVPWWCTVLLGGFPAYLGPNLGEKAIDVSVHFYQLLLRLFLSSPDKQNIRKKSSSSPHISPHVNRRNRNAEIGTVPVICLAVVVEVSNSCRLPPAKSKPLK